MTDIVITGAARTAMGGFQGAMSGATASELGATAIQGAIEKSGLKEDQIDD